jgi:hypothetical protein
MSLYTSSRILCFGTVKVKLKALGCAKGHIVSYNIHLCFSKEYSLSSCRLVHFVHVRNKKAQFNRRKTET